MRRIALMDIPSPCHETVTVVCAMADGLSDDKAGYCALELINLADDLTLNLTSAQRALLLRASAHLVRVFRTVHPEFYAPAPSGADTPQT